MTAVCSITRLPRVLSMRPMTGKPPGACGIAFAQETLPTSETEADARWYMEKLAIDFLKEDGIWKIWHMVPLPPTSRARPGPNYMEQKVDLPEEENAAYVEFGTPESSHAGPQRAV